MITTKSATLTAAACAGMAAALLGGCGTSTSASGSGGSTTSTAGTSTTTATSGTSGASSAGGAVGTIITGGAAEAGSTSAGLPRCHTSDLSATFTAVPNSEGAGNIVYNITLQNITSHTCTVYGHPGMLLLDADKKPLPTDVKWVSTVANTIVTLIPNAHASASDRFSPDVPGPGDATSGACQPTAAYTEITPPDETTQLVVPVSPATSVCERGTMQVSAFVPGSTGPGES